MSKLPDACLVCGKPTTSGQRVIWRDGYVHSTGRCRETARREQGVLELSA